MEPTPRERILAAAKEIFAAHGYRGGSLNDVAKLAGYTRAGLLHHFPSKEAMLLALLDERDEQMEDLLPAPGEEPTLLELLRLLRDATSLILGDRELVQLAHVLTAEASGADHPAWEWVARRQARLRAVLTEAAERSIACGELRIDADPRVLASLAFGMSEGLEAQWLVDPEISPVAGHRLFEELLGAPRTVR